MKNTNLLEKALQPVNSSLELLTQENILVARVSKISKLDQDDSNTYVRLEGINFHNGVIEADVCGKLLPSAPAHARGFIGIAFRINETDSEFECMYIRPANGKDCIDPVRKSHGCQYFSFPGYTFSYFREFGISGYEAPVSDIGLGEWAHLRIVVQDDCAELSVNGKPILKVSDLKHGCAARGSIGLYTDIGTDGYFRNLTVHCAD